jgi:hypothetical protein
MKILITILAIVACVSTAQAQSTEYERELNRFNLNNEKSVSDYWPTRSYYDPPPAGIQWNVERSAPQNDWYDIRTGHYTTPPPGVIQSGQFPTYNMPRP